MKSQPIQLMETHSKPLGVLLFVRTPNILHQFFSPIQQIQLLLILFMVPTSSTTLIIKKLFRLKNNQRNHEIQNPKIRKKHPKKALFW